MRRAEPVDIRDVPVVEVRVPLLGLSLRAGRAVALVPEAYRVGGGGGAAHRRVDGVETLVVAVGGVGGVDSRVAEAVVLGDTHAAHLASVEGHRECRQVEAEAPLALRDAVDRGGDGAAHRHIGEARQPGARARL